VCIPRRRKAQCPLKSDVARRLGQKLLSAEHEGDAHGGVIGNIGQMVGGHAVGLADDEVVQFARRDGHITHDLVTNGDVLAGGLESNDHRPTGLPGLANVVFIREGRRAGVHERLLLGLGLGSHGLQLLGCVKRVVGVPAVEQTFQD